LNAGALGRGADRGDRDRDGQAAVIANGLVQVTGALIPGQRVVVAAS
jgi:hypothetical protein